MSKLLHADNNRMLRSRVFRLGMVSLAALILLTFALEGDAGTLKRTESGFQGLLLFLPMVCSFIIILFVGHEFAGGAIRNKLIVGHLRSRVYTSWMVVGIGVTVIGRRCLPLYRLYVHRSTSGHHHSLATRRPKS